MSTRQKLLKKQRKVLALMLIGLISLIYSCGGGGGGGGSSQTSTRQEASLTSDNSQKASGGALQTINFVGGTYSVISSSSRSGKPGDKDISSLKSPLIDTLESIISISKDENFKKVYTLENGNREASEGPTTTIGLHCSYGGTMTVMTYTGDESDPVDLNESVTFNSCKNSSAITLDGSMNLKVEGSISNPTKMTFSSPSLTYVNTTTNDNMRMTNVTLTLSSITMSSGSLTGFTMSMSGSVSGTVSNNPIDAEYDNTIISYSENSSGITLSLSGSVKEACLGGWVTITTNKSLFIPTGGSCPTDGEIVITSGGNSVKVVIASDSKITVYYNNAVVQTYNDCTEVNGACVS